MLKLGYTVRNFLSDTQLYEESKKRNNKMNDESEKVKRIRRTADLMEAEKNVGK